MPYNNIKGKGIKKMHYVALMIDDADYNAVNQGLREIMICIGRDACAGKQLSEEDAFKKGVSVIDKQANRFHKRALYRLVQADREVRFEDDMEMKRKYIWFIHKTKAPKLMRIIRNRVERIDSAKCEQWFDTIYNILKKYSVEKKGDYLIGFPYYSTLKTLLRNQIDFSPYSHIELKALRAFCRELEPFRELYDKTGGII